MVSFRRQIYRMPPLILNVSTHAFRRRVNKCERLTLNIDKIREIFFLVRKRKSPKRRADDKFHRFIQKITTVCSFLSCL